MCSFVTITTVKMQNRSITSKSSVFALLYGHPLPLPNPDNDCSVLLRASCTCNPVIPNILRLAVFTQHHAHEYISQPPGDLLRRIVKWLLFCWEYGQGKKRQECGGGS